jgi:hypothetical protein
MIRITKVFVVLFSLLTAVSCSSYQPVTVKHVTELSTDHSRQGFFYSLPRNVVTVEVMVVKTESIPGPFAQYAGKYLGLDAVIERPATQYSINDVSVGSYAEADPSAFYFVEYHANRKADNPFSIVLNEGGIISGINVPQDLNEESRMATRKSLQGSFGSESTFNHMMQTNLQERIDTILERVRLDTVTIERKTLRRTWVEKTSEVRAKEVADHILRIRNKRFEIITGFAEVPYSRDAIQYMNDQLEKQENELLELFTGITTHSAIKYRYSFVPEKNNSGQPITLLHFDKRRGILEQPNANSEELRVNVSRDFATREMSPFVLNTNGKNTLPAGFYYRIPEHANVSVILDKKTIAEARLLVSQLGVITTMPVDNLMIEFYPNSGTIKSVERINR